MNFLTNILENKKNLTELIIAVVILGLGISFLASSIFEFYDFENRNLTFFIIGLFLSISGFIYYINSLFGKKKFSKKIEGFFILDIKKKKILNIDNYDYANKLYENIESAFSEDKELESSWESANFKNSYDFLPIIREASEYYLLEKLSMHLSAHFSNTKFDKKSLTEYERNDIPDILSTNRFLELFSKPMCERESFVSSYPDGNASTIFLFKRNGNKEPIGKIVSSRGVNDAKFDYFDLELPINSKVKRVNNDIITIKTKMFTVSIRTFIGGVSSYISKEYRDLYLHSGYSEKPAYVSTFEIEVQFNMLFLFRRRSWQYYEWIDTFIEQLEKDISEKYYFKNKIEWDKIYPILKILKEQKLK